MLHNTHFYIQISIVKIIAMQNHPAKNHDHYIVTWVFQCQGESLQNEPLHSNHGNPLGATPEVLGVASSINLA